MSFPLPVFSVLLMLSEANGLLSQQKPFDMHKTFRAFGEDLTVEIKGVIQDTPDENATPFRKVTLMHEALTILAEVENHQDVGDTFYYQPNANSPVIEVSIRATLRK